jgi:hypothetical protein
MSDLYSIMKGKAHPLARTIVLDHPDDDLFAVIMSDSEHPRQALTLESVISAEGHRKILLDGMAPNMRASMAGWPM